MRSKGDPSGKKWALKNEIKESCLSNVPAKDRKDYKEILNYVDDIANSILGVNNKYAHKNQNTIRMKPLHSDLELLYFSTSVITKYLTSLNNNKF
jgi:hypothetical protein